jgi:hypothetical protein
MKRKGGKLKSCIKKTYRRKLFGGGKKNLNPKMPKLA